MSCVVCVSSCVVVLTPLPMMISSTHERKSRTTLNVKNGKIYLKLNMLTEEVPIVILMKVAIIKRASLFSTRQASCLTRVVKCARRPWAWSRTRRWCSSWAASPTTPT